MTPNQQPPMDEREAAERIARFMPGCTYSVSCHGDYIYWYPDGDYRLLWKERQGWDHNALAPVLAKIADNQVSDSKFNKHLCRLTGKRINGLSVIAIDAIAACQLKKAAPAQLALAAGMTLREMEDKEK